MMVQRWPKQFRQIFGQPLLKFGLCSLAVCCLILTRPGFAVQSAPEVLSAQGQQAYELGEFQRAKQQWHQAASGYQRQHKTDEAALSLSHLALSYRELGQWSQAQQTIEQSLSLLKANQAAPQIVAQVLNSYGIIQLAMGQPEAALNTWQSATLSYREFDDRLGELGSQLNQAQALQTLGYYRRAQILLDELIVAVDAQSDSLLKAKTLRSLGNLLQVTGSLDRAHQLLQQSLRITEAIDRPVETRKTLFVLANTLRAQAETEQALQIYRQLIDEANSPIDRIEPQLNLVSLLVDSEDWNALPSLLAGLSQQLPVLQASRTAIYSRVNFVESVLKFNQRRPADIPAIATRELANHLARSVQQSRSLQDLRAESLALGQLGRLYIETQQWAEAKTVTQRAIRLAMGNHAKDIGYLWQWQLGKIYQQQGQNQRAIATYSEAVDTLSSVRADLLATNSELQFSIKEKVEPLYRELAGLLLMAESNDQNALNQARTLIEDLQLVELENYFRSACIDSQSEAVDQIDPEAAVIYPIILPDRLEVVLALPNQSLMHYRTAISQIDLENTLDQFFVAFNPALSNQRRLKLSQQLYDWLIRPMEMSLSQQSIKTLVFVLDGKLKNIPMAALYDGRQYLVENYSVALTPGLELMGPYFSQAKSLEALILGVSESRQGFSPLPGVEDEIEKIASNLKRSRIYLNQEFTKQAFESQIADTAYPILHLATHGQFSSDLASTFLLTWDQTISLADLDTLLKSRRLRSESPIELMVLSACQTAEGDDRATLGLAGMAIKSGARSTLATLWSVNDKSTVQLINGFYSSLSAPTGIPTTKAEALRQAQLSLLKSDNYAHPFYWASFVLIGNWLA